MNGRFAALLRDFAAIQKSKQSMWGYKRAWSPRRRRRGSTSSATRAGA